MAYPTIPFERITNDNRRKLNARHPHEGNESLMFLALHDLLAGRYRGEHPTIRNQDGKVITYEEARGGDTITVAGLEQGTKSHLYLVDNLPFKTNLTVMGTINKHKHVLLRDNWNTRGHGEHVPHYIATMPSFVEMSQYLKIDQGNFTGTFNFTSKGNILSLSLI